MQDERNGKPSASGIERLSLCPGSFNLEWTLPPLPESEDAASGTRIHRAIELSDPTGLSDDELWVYDRCRELRDETLTGIFGTEDKLLLEEERRLWMDNRISGKADLIAHGTSMAAILDYKSGRTDATTAEGNAQLRCLAVLLNHCARSADYEAIIVGVIQPRATEKVSLCSYDRSDLAKARKWLVDVLDAAEKPDAPRIPGEKQCRWCRAKAVCPEAQQQALEITNRVELVSWEKEPQKMPLVLTGEALGKFLEKAAHAEAIIEACRDEAKRRLSTGEEVPGWRLKEGATREVITDPEAVFTRFCERGGNSGAFMPAVTLNKAKLKDALKKVTGEKGKGLDAELDTLLAGLTESKQNAPSLERVKE